MDRYEKALEGTKLTQEERNFKTDSLVSLSRIFNEFLFIKDSLEIQLRQHSLIPERFELKPCILYVIDSLLSTVSNASITVNIDGGELEVVGDFNKFRQILVSITEYSLQNSDECKLGFKLK